MTSFDAGDRFFDTQLSLGFRRVVSGSRSGRQVVRGKGTIIIEGLLHISRLVGHLIRKFRAVV